MWIVIGVVAGLATLVVVSCAVVSSKCSRLEEQLFERDDS